ncbi:hypothetical protein PsAD2_03218 [Pseudovibrio axinellae]|uniref:Uncharacterized protein n=1 Tax=Pseudovibrio axinellae TaxID=989403 RepID=A0A165WZD0_9HYPH|nr:hypothetical protein [Pseudovibrio axinellae]KZL17090.1 hypothetical protein PsAD2_03218 [Pseudovibrio axinellae]SER91096.1 hypothetical protein SAMN05421798_1584 [Pseudovibrio axinellae]
MQPVFGKTPRKRSYLHSFFRNLLWRPRKVEAAAEVAPRHSDPAGTAHVVLQGRDRPSRSADVLHEDLSDELEIRGFLDQFPEHRLMVKPGEKPHKEIF